ncbi:hypothetical protein BDW68DRAFT_145690 [Aspergillus falconensis]
MKFFMSMRSANSSPSPIFLALWGCATWFASASMGTFSFGFQTPIHPAHYYAEATSWITHMSCDDDGNCFFVRCSFEGFGSASRQASLAIIPWRFDLDPPFLGTLTKTLGGLASSSIFWAYCQAMNLHQ